MTSPDRIRVLWLAKGLGPGGMERLLVNHARIGDRDRFDYSAAYLVDRPNSVVPELEDLGVTCTNIGAVHDLDPRWLLALRRLVVRQQINIVHVHSPMPAAMGRLLAKAMGGRGPKLVYTEHNTWDCYGRITRVANAATYWLDDAQLAVSNDAKASVPPRIRGRVEVLTHGIDIAEVQSHATERDRVRQELGVVDSDVAVITVAHLRAEKAYDVLLHAANRVLEEHPNARFISVGHGPLQTEMQQLHNQLDLGERFRFLGFRPDALDLMAGSDIFCLASHQEGLPVSFMEATALGLPTVATSVGGLVDHVQQNETGLLVKPADPDALADALGRVIDDNELRAQLGRNTKQRAGTFDATTAVSRQEQIYADLAASRRARGRVFNTTPGKTTTPARRDTAPNTQVVN